MSKMIIVEGNSNDKDNVRVLMVKGEKGEQGDLNHNDIVDNLTSSATDKVLSANQGKILKDLVDSNKSIADSSINTITSTLTDLNEDISEETTNRTTADNNLQSQISSLASGSPKAVNSISQMTDTTKNYVLTTDGHWYYYNGTTWADGGTYQSTGIADESITPRKTTFRKLSKINLFNYETTNIINGYFVDTGNIISDNITRSVYIECEPNTTYTISKMQSARFRVCTTNDTANIGVAISNYKEDNSGTSLTITTSSSAKCIVVFYYHGNYDNVSEEVIRKSIMIEKSTTATEFEDYYTLSIKTNDLDDVSVTPIKTSFSKVSRNLFDKDNKNLINAVLGDDVIVDYNDPQTFRSVYIECEPNTTYTVSKMRTARFTIGTTENTPSLGVSVLNYVRNNDATSLTITTPSNANYIVVFFYHAGHDVSITPEEILETLMIEKSNTAGSYVEHNIIEVDTDNLNNESVTIDKLSTGVKNAVLGMDRFKTRNKIYGIQFDITESNPICTRIADAEGLKNDFVVGSTYQLNNGVNDFDNIFPWCDIKLCNLSFDNNGNKIITYQGESGFSLDGTNGNVMVEIPKFYSMRERIGNNEIWAITGEPKSGFKVEPAFLVDGKEIDFVYVSAYNSSNLKNGNAFSYTNSLPTSGKTQSTYISNFSNVGLQSYDLSIFMLMQKLMTIEFATRNIQNYLGGITYLLYNYTGSTENLIKDKGTNYVVITKTKDRANYFYVGERVLVGGSEGSFNNARYITNIESLANNQLKITYDGEDLSGSLTVDTDGLYGCPQKNGLCDNLTYHTGRTNFSSGSMASYVNPFRYRYIENVWGNVWEKITGLKIKNLNYYYSFIPNYNEPITNNSEWKTVNYVAPLQPSLGETNKGWIVKNGYDNNNRLISLPTVVGATNDGGNNKYFSDCFYSKNETASTEYIACVGAGWDHSIHGGLFTLRGYLTANDNAWLYGNRAIYRG